MNPIYKAHIDLLTQLRRGGTPHSYDLEALTQEVEQAIAEEVDLEIERDHYREVLEYAARWLRCRCIWDKSKSAECPECSKHEPLSIVLAALNNR